MADAILAGRDGLPELGTPDWGVLPAATRHRCPSLGLRRPGTQELVWPVDGVLLDEGEPLGLGRRPGLVEAVDEDAQEIAERDAAVPALGNSLRDLRGLDAGDGAAGRGRRPAGGGGVASAGGKAVGIYEGEC